MGGKAEKETGKVGGGDEERGQRTEADWVNKDAKNGENNEGKNNKKMGKKRRGKNGGDEEDVVK